MALTRHGKPVAVIVSTEAFERLSGDSPDFVQAIQAFRRTHRLDELDLDLDVFENVRDPKLGRKVDL